MTGIDYAIILAYLVLTLAIGLRAAGKMESGADFFLAGKRLPWWAIGLSLVVTDIGAKDIVGLAQDSYRHGLVMANWDWTGCIPAMVLAGLVFVPYFWAGGFYTVPEYFGRRYNEGVRTVTTIVWGLFIAGNIAVIFSACTAVIAPMMGLEEYRTEILVITTVVIGIYTCLGGLAAVVYTDVIQCLLMIAGMALVLYHAFHAPGVGSWQSLRETVTATHPDHFKLFHPVENPSSFTTFSVVFGLGVVLGPAYWIGNQAIVQRTLGAKSMNQARGGVFFGAIVKLIFPILLVLPGILAIVILPEELKGEETKEVFPRLVKDLLPPGSRGLVFAALLAGLMGNLTGYLNSASTLWTRDILRKYVFRPYGTAPEDESSARLDLLIGRVLTILFLATGAVLSIWVQNIFETMQWMLSLFQGPTLALLVLGMFWRRATAWGGFAGIVIGLCCSQFLNSWKQSLFGYWTNGGTVWVGYENPYLHVAWWSFVAACVVMVVVSVFTRPYSAERLRGLVYGSPLGQTDPHSAQSR